MMASETSSLGEHPPLLTAASDATPDIVSDEKIHIEVGNFLENKQQSASTTTGDNTAHQNQQCSLTRTTTTSSDYHSDSYRLPTLMGPWPCRYTPPGGCNLLPGFLYYCCLVVCIKWDRHTNQLRVYIDARGEWDLAHPRLSTMRHVKNGAATITGTWVEAEQTEKNPQHVPGLWGGRCYKGYVSFDGSDFDKPGAYTFCYGCRHPGTDFESIQLFTIPNSIAGLSAVCSRDGLDSTDATPFLHDTVKTERRRWNNIVMTGNEIPERMLI